MLDLYASVGPVPPIQICKQLLGDSCKSIYTMDRASLLPSYEEFSKQRAEGECR